MTPGTVTLLELLARDEKAHFIIPPWRRQYAWSSAGGDRTEVERLWQDIRGKCVLHGKHYCGVMLLHKVESEIAPTWEIIDGQQRMATFFLLLMALRDVCEKRGVNCTDLNILIKTANANDCRLALQGEPCSDRRVMQALFRRSGFSLEQKIKDESKVFRAYRYLLAQIESEVSSGSQEFLVSVLQGIEFRIQLAEPNEETRRAFEVLDAQAKQADDKKVAPAQAKKEPLISSVLRTVDAPRRPRKPVVFGVIGLVLLLVLIGFALWWQDYRSVKTGYYQGINQRLGIPEGVDKLTAEQAAHRAICYRIESTRGKVFRVTEINGSGSPVDDPDLYHASTEEMIYVENSGHLSGINFSNHNGQVVFEKDYREVPSSSSGAAHQEIDFKFRRKRPGANSARNFPFLGSRAFVNEVDGKSNVAGEVVEYTAEGRPRHIQYRKGGGQPGSDSNAIFGQDFDYNSDGQLVKITNLGPDGKPSPDKHGIAALTRTYDPAGNQIDETLLDAKGQPLLGESNYAKVVFKYDEHSNKIEVIYLGVDGQPVFNKMGFASVTSKYDEHANLIEQSCRGFKGELVLNTNGYSTETLKYDSSGKVIEVNFLDTDGKPVSSRDGYAAGKLSYDTRGNIVQEAYLDTEGKPLLNKSGHASETFKFDEHDNAIEFAGFGVDSLPVMGADGYARMVSKYNDRGNKIEASYFDVAGQPVLNKKGVARETFDYDGNDNVISQSYFGTNGESLLNKDGAAKLTAKYDDRGNVIETACYSIDGQPALDKNGVAVETYKYDQHDNVIEAACFGMDGHPVLDMGGVARATFKYNDRGNKIESDYFGVDGNPIRNRGGFGRETFKYDERGNTIEGAYFDIKGQPTLGPNGFARETLKYDERNRVVEAACFGLEGQPIDLGGAHRIVYTYDASGKISKTERFDRNDQPVP